MREEMLVDVLLDQNTWQPEFVVDDKIAQTKRYRINR